MTHCESAGGDSIVELLLERGARINGGGGDTITPLYKAITRGNNAMVRLLLASKNARLSLEHGFGNRMLTVAICYRQLATVRLLLEQETQVRVGQDQHSTV